MKARRKKMALGVAVAIASMAGVQPAFHPALYRTPVPQQKRRGKFKGRNRQRGKQ